MINREPFYSIMINLLYDRSWYDEKDRTGRDGMHNVEGMCQIGSALEEGGDWVLDGVGTDQIELHRIPRPKYGGCGKAGSS